MWPRAKQELIAAEGDLDLAWAHLREAMGSRDLKASELKPIEPHSFSAAAAGTGDGHSRKDAFRSDGPGDRRNRRRQTLSERRNRTSARA